MGPEMTSTRTSSKTATESSMTTRRRNLSSYSRGDRSAGNWERMARVEEDALLREQIEYYRLVPPSTT